MRNKFTYFTFEQNISKQYFKIKLSIIRILQKKKRKEKKKEKKVKIRIAITFIRCMLIKHHNDK